MLASEYTENISRNPYSYFNRLLRQKMDKKPNVIFAHGKVSSDVDIRFGIANAFGKKSVSLSEQVFRLRERWGSVHR